MRRALLTAVLALTACSSAPEKKAAAPPPPPKPVKDNTSLLLAQNRTAARVVPDFLLGNHALPGGTLGDYDENGTKYQLFVIETPSAQDAAILLLDLKATLKNPAYIAYMGGYFGMADAGPLYAFAKGKYLAGVAGLPQDKADPIARQLAARLR
jgi:hypothetical protein